MLLYSNWRYWQIILALCVSFTICVSNVNAEQSKRFIVKFETTTNKSLASSNTRSTPTSYSSSYRISATNPRSQEWILTTPSNIKKSELIESLTKDNPSSKIEYIEEDVKTFPANAADTDQFYSEQWHLFDDTGGIKADLAWETTIGSEAITVAVIDSGIITTHEDLVDRLVPGYDFVSLDFVDGEKLPLTANDGDGRDPDPTDPGDWVTHEENIGEDAFGVFMGCGKANSTWHGTHIAGTIGASSDNGTGVTGVDKKARIMPLRALGKCGGYVSDIAAAIRWAAGDSQVGVDYTIPPVDVINLSLSRFGSCTRTEQRAIDFAINQGVTVVIAAGNGGGDINNYAPANCKGVITVGATDVNGKEAFYSNRGDVSVYAPGGFYQGILSTSDLGQTTSAEQGYVELTGTSMAAAQVTGVVSLMKSLNPELHHDEIHHILVATSQVTEAPNTNLVNAFAAVEFIATGQDIDENAQPAIREEPKTKSRGGTMSGLLVILFMIMFAWRHRNVAQQQYQRLIIATKNRTL